MAIGSGLQSASAARIARGVAAEFHRDVVVAGSMGPTGELFQPIGPLDFAAGRAAFSEQAEALKAGGADVLWIETMSSPEEVAAAHAGANDVGLPTVTTMTFDTAGRTMMGVTPADAFDYCRNLEPRPLAIGSNCGAGPSEVVASVAGMAGATGTTACNGPVAVVAKGNCGIPDFIDGELHYTGTPELMVAYARLSRDAGARIIGGCCGSTERVVNAIADSLHGYEPKGVPDLAAIEAALGPVGAATKAALRSLGDGLGDGGEAEKAAARRRGRRRRRS